MNMCYVGVFLNRLPLCGRCSFSNGLKEDGAEGAMWVCGSDSAPGVICASVGQTHLCHESHDILNGAPLQPSEIIQLPACGQWDGIGSWRVGIDDESVDFHVEESMDGMMPDTKGQ